MKEIGFLLYRPLNPVAAISQVRSASDTLLQSIRLAVSRLNFDIERERLAL